MSELLNALRRNLANREEIGDEETAELLRARIAAEEKAEKKADTAEPPPDPIAFAVDDEPAPVKKTTKKEKT